MARRPLQVWSHSRLSCFENCPKQFHFRYVLRLPVDTESIEAFLGKQVHAVLERLNHFVRRGRIPGLAAVLDRFERNWTERFSAERIRIARPEHPARAYQENGKRCLRNHYRRHYPFEGEETLGIEEEISFDLDADGDYRMRGIIDRLARTPDGVVEIHDYKTGQRIPPQRVLDADRQLALYQLGVARRLGVQTPVRLVWHYLFFDRVCVSTRSAEQLRELEARTAALIDRIRAEERFEPSPGPLCRWCEFQSLCPASGVREGASEAPRAAPAAHPSAPPSPAPAVVASQLGLFG